ncbi:MAG: hypothetical protein JRG93_20020 [Deltaproteobacteria bacterium]|nr:hypothetical protein [Deltaproteobacteria bacterium]
MSYKSTAFLAVVLMSSACAGETPFAPGLVPGGGEGGDGGGANTKLEPGQCWTGRDCELGEACKPSEYTESAAKNIDITESGTPGSCEAPPPEQMLMLRGISAVRFTQGGSSLDPANDDFVVEQGVFDIDFAVEAQGVTQALKIEAVELPFDPGSVGFGFYWTLDMHLRVVDPLDPDYDVECNLRFLRSGDVEGGVARGSGKVVCSTNNWQPPQDPGDPGLLVEYELLPVEPDPGPVDPNGMVCSRSALPAGAQSAIGSVACQGLAGDRTVFEVRISAEPLGPIEGETAFEVQAQLVNPEEIVATFIDVLGAAVLAEASVELSQVNAGNPIALAVETPCEVDYTVDPDDNGTPGPMTMTTEAGAAVWTAVDGSITVEATEMSFRLVSVVNVALSTGGANPSCTWVEVPRLTFGSGG